MSFTMYRLLSFTLCISATLAAPQSPQENSNITYVKQQSTDTPAETISSERESRIEKIPLIIPGNVDTLAELDGPKFREASAINATIRNTDEANLDQNVSISNYPDKNEPNKTSGDDLIINGLPDPIIDPTSNTDIVFSDSLHSKSLIPDNEFETDNLASESRQNDKQVKTDATTPTYDENITVDNESLTDTEATIAENIELEPTRAPKHLPKLSHFGKSDYSTSSNNLIGGFGKRRFRSRCSCQKIWNCPKLQISVPRCPEEYFMCCS